jgi:hypothetical protein
VSAANAGPMSPGLLAPLTSPAAAAAPLPPLAPLPVLDHQVMLIAPEMASQDVRFYNNGQQQQTYQQAMEDLVGEPGGITAAAAAVDHRTKLIGED